MTKFKTTEELYKILNDTIEGKINGTISEELFNRTIDHLNKNPFGIFIDKSLIKTSKNVEEDEDEYDSYEEDSSYSY